MRDQQQIPEPTRLETLFRSLLGAEDRSDAESRVVDGVRTLFGACWTALLTPGADGAVCVRSCGMHHGWAKHDLASPDDPRPREATAAAEAHAALRAEIDVGEVTALLLVGPAEGGAGYDEHARDLLDHIRDDLAATLRRAHELDRLRSQALVDALTGCFNRRGFDEQLIAELRRAQRYERAAALMLVDLDGFKRINDELGHQAGDHVLRRFAGLLSGTFRTTDVVARYGGDEFAVVFPETTTPEAERLAERVRALLGSAFPDEVVPRGVSASFGIASFPSDASDAEELIATADRALYAAKLGGRDRVVTAGTRGSTSR